MENIKRAFDIEKGLEWSYGITIKNLREELDRLEAKGATHIEIDAEIRYDVAYVEINAFALRLETDDERDERLAKSKRREEEKERRELEEFRRLQKKFKTTEE